MKKQILVIAMLLFAGFGTVNAQVGVHVNIGVQPVWGPTGYDYAQFYYIPDIDAYYNVATGEYTYLDRGAWVTYRHLPPAYANYDLYHGYKVVINEPTPWFHHDRYRAQYAQYRGRHDQPIIRESHDRRYFENPNHPMHNQWHGGDRRDGGRDRGHEDHGHDERR